MLQESFAENPLGNGLHGSGQQLSPLLLKSGNILNYLWRQKEIMFVLYYTASLDDAIVYPSIRFQNSKLHSPYFTLSLSSWSWFTKDKSNDHFAKEDAFCQGICPRD